MVDTAFFKNNGPFTLAQIAEVCEAELEDKSKADVQIKDLATMFTAGEGEICFFFDKKKKAAGAEIKATACVTTPELAPFVPENVIKLISANPHLGFVKLNYAMYEEYKPQPGISPKASVAPTAQIGKDCYIGDFAVIEEGVKIGDNCIIEPHATIGRNCQIGSRCRIGAGAGISHCIMGNDCYIYGGARIGWDGFGFMMLQGQHKRIPQLGRVIIGNDVEIGANSCVDRGALDDTVIGDGCRIDDLVMVAHNVKLGRGCILVSQTGIAGSCTFGDFVVCGGQTGFADHLNVGSGAQIGAQSGIMRDIEPGTVVMGTPAVPIKDFMRQVSYIQKLSKK
ncbi:MAG: UDP-3-O-(3-hydroxymyristoyl)glucosamine N-acyltransferase [Proteobacteria bacterium]|nr:UDP-3-O-(3-hydroxymyristoyl)glucosamine N-acyltransferase [Pseudomonadota bacterium]